ncbi:MAG: ATP-binding protein, partial [Bacillota bacterium]
GQEVAEANDSLRRALTQAGATDIRDYQDRAERYGRYEKQVAEHRRQAELLRQALGGDTRDGLEARLAELAELAESAPVGAAPFPDAELEARERELRARHEQASAMERELSRDRGILDGRYGELPDPADLDRRLEAARHELDGWVAERDILSMASELIIKASDQVQRRFAPALNAEVGSSVARLTGGAYPDVRVDRGFAMTVVVDGQSHDVGNLSRGTLDQFYFALRLAVTGLLTGGAETPPFILDDSLVHYDDERAAAALALLAEVGRTHQVMLFTCHRREVTTARTMGAQATVIELCG